VYSAAYNGLVVGPEIIICVLIACIPAIDHMANQLKLKVRK